MTGNDAQAGTAEESAPGPGSPAGVAEGPGRIADMGPATDDEPTVERRNPAAQIDDGETQRLRPPAVVPGAVGADRSDGAPDADRSDDVPGADRPDEVSAGEATEPRAAAASPESVMSSDDSGHEPLRDSAHVPKNGVDPPWKRLSSAGALIWVLLALFGFTLVVQLRSNDTDEGLASARQEDLVRILSDLEARDTRLQSEINALETSQRQLTSGVAGREAALAEADKRADELGLLAGTMAGRGPGLRIVVNGVKASAILNAVQELRGAGGEVMQVAGANGDAVRIVASTYFVDAEGGGIVVDGVRLTGPYTLSVIGAPQTMQTALQIPGGVVASVNSDGGSVTMEQRTSLDVTAVRTPTSLQYARPVS